MKTITDIIKFPEGMEHDLKEGWHKLTSRQQGGRPAKAIKELIQNALDSYPEEIPIKERKGEVITGKQSIAIKDFGNGMTQEQIEMLYTVGGTSKYGVHSMIGNFGIGFKQLFNHKLGTTQVKVTTVCGGFPVEIAFIVNDPKSVPKIQVNVLKTPIDFGTMVEVFFNNSYSAKECLEEAINTLRYYPCRFTINGTESISEWDKAQKAGARFFSKEGIDGYILPVFSNYESRIVILCKYEFIRKTYISDFMSGTAKRLESIYDYGRRGTPYIPGLRIVVNSMDLNVVISRDSFYCDDAFTKLTEVVNEALLDYLDHYLNSTTNRQIILANLYSLKYKISSYLEKPQDFDVEKASTRALEKLTRQQVFRVAEKRELFSIRDIINKRTPDLPLFYSPKLLNVRWLGGQFKHDFVLTPYPFELDGGYRGFYNEVLGTIFKDTVNLDNIHLNAQKLKDLVQRGIIDPASLSPEIKFTGNKVLNDQQNKLLMEINGLLSCEKIREAISNNFDLDIQLIQATFFEVNDAGMYISTGLFNHNGKPVSEDYITNIMGVNNKEKVSRRRVIKKKILLGLNLKHPLISYLCSCLDPDRVAFSLPNIVNQLAMCQRSLVPYSSFYHLDKAKLAKDMRSAMLEPMIGKSDDKS